MKSFRILTVAALIVLGYSVHSQSSNPGNTDIYTLEGVRIKSAGIVSGGCSLVVIFFNCDDSRSLGQLSEANEEYESSLKGKNVKVVGICTGYSGNAESIRPLISGMRISFEVYVDRNCELKRAMNIPELPFTLIAGPESEICGYTGYCENIQHLMAQATDNRNAALSKH